LTSFISYSGVILFPTFWHLFGLDNNDDDDSQFFGSVIVTLGIALPSSAIIIVATITIIFLVFFYSKKKTKNENSNEDGKEMMVEDTPGEAKDDARAPNTESDLFKIDWVCFFVSLWVCGFRSQRNILLWVYKPKNKKRDNEQFLFGEGGVNTRNNVGCLDAKSSS